MNDSVLRLVHASLRPRRSVHTFGHRSRRPLSVAQRMKKRMRDRQNYRKNRSRILARKRQYDHKRKYFSASRKHGGSRPAYLNHMHASIASAPRRQTGLPHVHHTQPLRHRAFTVKRPRAHIQKRK